MTVDDFRRLNFREVGSWPWLPKVIVLVIVLLFIVGLGAFFDWKDRFARVTIEHEELPGLRRLHDDIDAAPVASNRGE